MPTTFSCLGCESDDQYSTTAFCKPCHDSLRTKQCRSCGRNSNIDKSRSVYSKLRGEFICQDCTRHHVYTDPFKIDCGEKHDKMGTKRRYGIELETDICPSYHWAFDSIFGIKSDGSISGREFVSPPLSGDVGYDHVVKFCDTMESKQYSVDRSCGYHVHIDLTDATFDQIKATMLGYTYTEDIWQQLVAPHRRNTGYARSNLSYRGYKYWDRKDLMAWRSIPDLTSRYVWCNIQAYNRHKTIEIRNHEGTINGQATMNWAKAHAKFVDYCTSLTVGQVTRRFGGDKTRLDHMKHLKDIWEDQDLTDYYMEKAALA